MISKIPQINFSIIWTCPCIWWSTLSLWSPLILVGSAEIKTNDTNIELNKTQEDSFLNYSVTSGKKNSSEVFSQGQISSGTSTNETFDSTNSRFIREIAENINNEDTEYEREQIYKIKVR